MFDTGAKFQNTCLNYNILKGSNLLNNLLFDQDDQQALGFLWRDNPNQAFEDTAMTVHVFGKADSPCCAN